jgi:thiamine-monophosphate kinase
MFNHACRFVKGTEEKMNFTPISSIGEFGLVDKFASLASRFSNARVVTSIGDDAAVLKTVPGNLTVVTTDILVQSVHFDPSYTSMRHLGQKAAAVNLSDIAAMSALPTAAFVSLGIHSNLSVEMVEEFYDALTSEFGRFGCAVAGGDTSASPVGFIVNVAVAGEVEPDRLPMRSGAKAGDIVCVTGDLGRAHAGLKVLQREKTRYVEAGQPPDFIPDFEGYDTALQRHLMPDARIQLSREITDKIRVHSMIDVSDGLVSDMLHICRASGVSASLDEEFIPLDPITRRTAQEFKEDPLTYALYGGEDYELLFTIAENDFQKLYSLEGFVRAIGRISEGEPGVSVRRMDGTSESYKDFPSFQHFARRNKL